MKKLALALTALAAFTGSAVAADLPARTYKAPPPVVAPVASFTGLWISGGFGYGLAQYETDVSSVGIIPPVVFDPGHNTGLRGWLGKVGVGSLAPWGNG